MINQNQIKIEESLLQEFVLKAVGDVASSMSAMLTILGDRLGLYRALNQYGPLTSEELAAKTNTSERYIREWLANQAAGGYINFDPNNGKFNLSPEKAMVLADENSPVYIHGAYHTIKSLFKDEEKFVEIFKTGKGLRWGEHHHDLFEGTAKFFKPNYIGNLLQSWIPSLDEIEDKLKKGAKVADIGCGYGITTILMAKAYPNSQFFGFDNHKPSIETAIVGAKKDRVTKNTEFKSVSANQDIGNDYDLVTFFDSLHDMGDPIGALKFAKQSLKSDGTCMIVEPMANDDLKDNLNLVGRVFYAASALVCVPNSIADNGPALGAQAGEKRIRGVVEKAGFTRFRRATQTPFNIIYEVKP